MADFNATLQVLKELVPPALQNPQVGIICGSGLSGLAATLRQTVLVPYDRLPGFVQSTVPGHRSSLAFGLMGSGAGVPVIAMLGRFHPYEGHRLSSVVYPVRVMAKMGVNDIIITNAAGALNPELAVGTIVVVHDHIALPNLTGMNPLLGPQTNMSLPRFLPLSDAYSRLLRKLVFRAAHDLLIKRDALAEGTYAWVSGPTYETPAEGRFLRAAGADVVGMSTVPEVLAAREEGMNVLVLSLVTNAVVIPTDYRSVRDEFEAENTGMSATSVVDEVVSHEEVLALGRLKGDLMKTIVEKVIDLIPSNV
ncbi:nucleoside phosphorylase domain-containing protein [Lentinula lateritia]|uniref:Nucleoside phosphorylase domain-containing protein n=1 Tax=Lentinula aff. lateritia TaxID=2804960 RepID=A0ACC1TSF7_9AGAR|nr:nucleoside phosphorylase domain-containing protein [Lentinula aff. lateritia]KAJ3853977.1 nucleoside phosphorylase domain-containing protein [Lentinula lateritia]